MDLLVLANAADNVSAMEIVSEVASPEEVYEIVAGDSLDFNSWTSLISEIEKTYSDNIKAISSVYESFLSWFPLCHGYWKKYADHMARLCNVEKAAEIYEQAVQSATYSVGLWVDYCSFSILAFADPFDIRRIFERGLSFVGKDFLCHRLWDLYIRFELSQQQWSFLAHVLIRALKFPTKSLHKYYDSFKEFAAFVVEDMSFSNGSNLEPYVADLNIEAALSDDEIYHAIKELQDSSSVDLRSKALNKLVSIGELFYNNSCRLHEKIDYFENYMERDVFSVKPLDAEDLQNWHNYLDFIEKQQDFDWAVKVYERCLIPCANYPEFWMRYVEFMESKGGRELANFALERATQVFLKCVSEVHIYNARFRERIGDIEGARAAFHRCNTESDSSFIDTAINEANMETRLGNVDIALEIYDKALQMAAKKQRMNIIPVLYIHLFRLKFLITGSADDAIDLLVSGIQQVPFSRLLVEELINFTMMHEGSKHLNAVNDIIDTVVTSGSDGSQVLSSNDREDLSNLYLKFVDFCGTTDDIRKAWNRHMRYFPHLVRNTVLHKCPSKPLSDEPKKPKKRKPGLVVKQPTKVRSNEHEKRKYLTSKTQRVDPHKSTVNQHKDKDNDTPLKENTHFQQEEDNATEELSGKLSQNDMHISQKDDQIRLEPEKDHEYEDAMNPLTANQNSVAESAKEQNKIDEREREPEREHEPEPEPEPEHEREHDLQQVSSQNMETRKTDQVLTASEHVPNVQQPQNPVSASLLTKNGQPVVQYPVQSSEQPGVVQNPQVYNQMWPYQYQNQQQWLQMQQYIQQQQQQQFQPQQQYHQFYQQQEQYQQYWLQLYQQQQQQQQQLQEYNIQMQQFQQTQHQQLPKDLHQNHLQQIAAMPNMMWNISHDQQAHQGQGMMPPNTTMPYSQANPANVGVQPMATPTNIVSPSNLHQPSNSK